MWLRKNKPRTLIPIVYACAGVLATMPSITREEGQDWALISNKTDSGKEDHLFFKHIHFSIQIRNCIYWTIAKMVISVLVLAGGLGVMLSIGIAFGEVLLSAISSGLRVVCIVKFLVLL